MNTRTHILSIITIDFNNYNIYIFVIINVLCAYCLLFFCFIYLFKIVCCFKTVISIYDSWVHKSLNLEIHITTPYTVMTWCLGTVVIQLLYKKVEKNVKVNCGKYCNSSATTCSDRWQTGVAVVYCYPQANAVTLVSVCCMPGANGTRKRSYFMTNWNLEWGFLSLFV